MIKKGTKNRTELGIVRGSTFFKNKRIAPMVFMFCFEPADEQKKRLVICTHTYTLCYYVILSSISVC
jgi:hypothetical protein